MSNFAVYKPHHQGTLSYQIHDPVVDEWDDLVDITDFLHNRAESFTMPVAQSFGTTQPTNKSRLILHLPSPEVFSQISLAGLSITENMTIRVYSGDVAYPIIPSNLQATHAQTVPARPRLTSNQVINLPAPVTTSCIMVEFEYSDNVLLTSEDFSNLIFNGDFSQGSNGWEEQSPESGSPYNYTYDGTSIHMERVDIGSGFEGDNDVLQRVISVPNYSFPVRYKFSFSAEFGGTYDGPTPEHTFAMTSYLAVRTIFSDVDIVDIPPYVNQSSAGNQGQVIYRYNSNGGGALTGNYFFEPSCYIDVPANPPTGAYWEAIIFLTGAQLEARYTNFDLRVDLDGDVYRGLPFDIKNVFFGDVGFTPTNRDLDSDSKLHSNQNFSDLNTENTLIRRPTFTNRSYKALIKDLDELDYRILKHLLSFELPSDGYCLFRLDPDDDNPEDYFIAYVRDGNRTDTGSQKNIFELYVDEVSTWL